MAFDIVLRNPGSGFNIVLDALPPRLDPTFSEWNGVTEVALTLDGEWNGTSIVPVTFEQVVGG